VRRAYGRVAEQPVEGGILGVLGEDGINWTSHP
jgi:hypothetical protein